MATVTNKKKVLIVEVTTTNRKWDKKGNDACWEFGPVSYTIPKICKNRTKIINAFEDNGWKMRRY
jgi:hypothetical protein